jgi:hypothetical protein
VLARKNLLPSNPPAPPGGRSRAKQTKEITMSEFHCRNGHLMLSSDGPRCRECGEKVFTMDGLTNRQLRKMEEAEERLEDDETRIHSKHAV